MTTIRRTTNLALSPERVMQYAEENLTGDARTRVLDLAGHWKHGYIPLDAVAYAIKMKQQRGDGKRRRGITRGSQSDREPFRGEGSPVAPKPREAGRGGKSRHNPEAHAAAAKAHLTGGRSKDSAPRPAAVAQPPERVHIGGDVNAAGERIGPKTPNEQPRRKRAPSKHYQEFVAERDAQKARYENHVGTGRNVSNLTEDEYFGEGEHEGKGGVEQRLTFKRFNEGRRQGKEHERRGQAAWDEGRKLGAMHGYRGSHPDDNADYDAASKGHDDESFGGGYSDGAEAGAAKRAKDDAAASNKPQVVGSMSNHGEIVSVARTNGKHRVKIDGRNHGSGHDTREQALAEAHTLVPEHRRAGSEDEARALHVRLESEQEQKRKDAVAKRAADNQASAAKQRAESARDESDRPQTDAEHAEAGNVGNKLQALYYDDASRGRLSVADLDGIIGSRFASENDKAMARRLRSEKSQAAAAPMAKRLQDMSDEQFASALKNGPLSGSNLTQGQKRAIAAESRRRLEARKQSGTAADELAAKRAEKAAQTPRELGERLERDPSSLSMDELQRLSAGGNKWSSAANAEIGRRDDAEIRRRGGDPDGPIGGKPAVSPAYDAALDAVTSRQNRHMEETLAKVSTSDLEKVANDPRANPNRRATAIAELRRREQRRAITGRPDPKGEAPQDGAAEAGIRVEHSGDGTVVYGTERGDTEATAALKAQGFKWSRNLGGWYLPRTWGEATRDQRVRGLEKALGGKVSVDRGDVGKSTTAAERSQQRIDRARELAASHTDRAERKATEADVRLGKAKAIGDMIPMGQPILVGHHSEGRHRRDLANIDRNMRAGFEAQGESEQATARAASAAARARQELDPKAAARRLKRNEAELRLVERRLAGQDSMSGGPATGEYADRLNASRAELADQIAHDRSIAGEPQYGKHNLQAGDVVVIRGTPHVIASMGPKNVKVLTSVGPLPYPYTQIDRAQTLDKSSTASLQRLLAASQNPGPNQQSLPAGVEARIRSILSERGDT